MILQEHKIWRIPLILLLAFWLGGCSMQEGEDMPDFEDEGELFLVLNISTLNSGSSGTRAPGPDYFKQPILTEKMNSLRVIIVDVQPESETKDKVIFNEHSFLNYTLGITGWRYKINFDTKYNVYLIANEEGLSNNIQNQLENLIPGSDYTKNTLENIVISNSVNISAGSAFISNDPTYLTDGQSSKPIPMTEMFVVGPVSRPNDTNSNDEEIKVEVKKEMFVTRMASKFTFCFFKSEDYIPDPDKTTIKSIKISGLRKGEYLLPRAKYDPPIGEQSTNNFNGREITEYDIPSTIGNTTPIENSVGDYVFTLPEEGLNVSTISEEGYMYSPQIYFPDSPITDGKNLTCTISYDGNEYEVPPVELDNLIYGLPRNTHAIVNITIGNSGKLFVTVDIVPWTELYLTLDYNTETVVVEDFQWDPDSYESFDAETGTLVMKPWYAGKAVPLVGKFKITSPVGAFWNASLIGNGVILFDEVYYQTNSIMGYINDTSDEEDDPLPGVSDDQYRSFNIISTIENPEQDYSAVLQLTVTLPNGKVMEVPLTPKDKSYKKFTIVQYGK